MTKVDNYYYTTKKIEQILQNKKHRQRAKPVISSLPVLSQL